MGFACRAAIAIPTTLHVSASHRIIPVILGFRAFTQQRSKTIRLIRLAMAAAVLLPCTLFAFASWTAYRSLHVLADERLLRSLDVLQEEAAKTFELTNLTMSNASDLVAACPAEISARTVNGCTVSSKNIPMQWQ
jgi:hypothetical protein